MNFGFSILAKILKLGYQPDVITLTTLIKVSYGTLIDELCKIGETRAALQVLRRIEGKLAKPNVVLRKLKGDVYIFSILLDALCKEGNVKQAKNVLAVMMQQAMNLFKEMQSKKLIPNTVTYSSLIDGLCKSGRISHAWELLEEM
ncbi:pentatricopeptide repeat-containing protein, partial [Trifolium pratense]